jgi:hypothetical protein
MRNELRIVARIGSFLMAVQGVAQSNLPASSLCELQTKVAQGESAHRVHFMLRASLSWLRAPVRRFFFRRRLHTLSYSAAIEGYCAAPDWGRRVLPKTDAVGSVLLGRSRHYCLQM